jgi:glutathione S-transferase
MDRRVEPGDDDRRGEGTMIKIWGRNTSVNVQKVMWAVGELGLAHERIDVGGAFGKNREPAYLAMNPNGLVPTLEDGDFLLWESNSIVRYLAAKYGAGTLEPKDLQARARASSWMDWQLTVAHPPLTPVFWGLIRTPPEKRDHAAIEAGKVKSMAAMKILDAQLAKTAYVAGDTLSMGDIPVALMAYRFRRLVPEREGLDNLERWFTTIEQRPAFKEHVLAIPFV